MPGYSLLDRALHRLALGVGPVAEMSFDIDQRMAGAGDEAADGRHVFIAGLARAGTTALMRRFHATGLCRSLTYRDMPFVLAPNLWRRMGGGRRGAGTKVERAHGDGVMVDADSPESLDEVFWRVFDGDAYILPDRLVPHNPPPELLQRFVRYVGAILKAQDGGATRYLSKNNNNVLRLGAIRRAFPRAAILIPVREPAAHAASLLNQHRNFSAAQAADGFVGDYMGWLGHHEFGADHRPFRFDEAAPDKRTGSDPDSIDHWIELWIETYRWLELCAPEGAVFVCYEDLCSNPATWRGLAALSRIEDAGVDGEPFRRGASAPARSASAGLLAEATSLHERLRDKARQALC